MHQGGLDPAAGDGRQLFAKRTPYRLSHDVRFAGMGPVGMLMSRSEESPIGSPHSSASASPSNEVRGG